jgi:hypothetical protein
MKTETKQTRKPKKGGLKMKTETKQTRTVYFNGKAENFVKDHFIVTVIKGA